MPYVHKIKVNTTNLSSLTVTTCISCKAWSWSLVVNKQSVPYSFVNNFLQTFCLRMFAFFLPGRGCPISLKSWETQEESMMICHTTIQNWWPHSPTYQTNGRTTTYMCHMHTNFCESYIYMYLPIIGEYILLAITAPPIIDISHSYASPIVRCVLPIIGNRNSHTPDIYLNTSPIIHTVSRPA